jgi:hypothetical protein
MNKRALHIIQDCLVISTLIAIALLTGSCNLNDKWEMYYGDAPGHTTYTVMDLFKENPEFSMF